MTGIVIQRGCAKRGRLLAAAVAMCVAFAVAPPQTRADVISTAVTTATSNRDFADCSYSQDAVTSGYGSTHITPLGSPYPWFYPAHSGQAQCTIVDRDGDGPPVSNASYSTTFASGTMGIFGCGELWDYRVWGINFYVSDISGVPPAPQEAYDLQGKHLAAIWSTGNAADLYDYYYSYGPRTGAPRGSAIISHDAPANCDATGGVARDPYGHFTMYGTLHILL